MLGSRCSVCALPRLASVGIPAIVQPYFRPALPMPSSRSRAPSAFYSRINHLACVAAPVITEIFDTPLACAEAILVDRHLPMEGIDRGIDEAIPALKAPISFGSCAATTSLKVLGLVHAWASNTPSAPNLPSRSFRPVLPRLPPDCRRLPVLRLGPLPSIGRIR